MTSTHWVMTGAPEWTRTTTPLLAQALNLPRIPFRHGGVGLLLPYAGTRPHPAPPGEVPDVSIPMGLVDCQR
jgi:hypothetical protein